MAVAIAAFGIHLVELMATSPEVREEARAYLIYLAIAPLAGCAAFMLDGIFIGATRSRDIRNIMFVSFVLYCIALAALLPTFGNHGLWISLLIAFGARGVTLAIRYPPLVADIGEPRQSSSNT